LKVGDAFVSEHGIYLLLAHVEDGLFGDGAFEVVFLRWDGRATRYSLYASLLARDMVDGIWLA